MPEWRPDLDGEGPEPPQVPGFERLQELGRGARTVVYRVRRTGTDGPDYALKILRTRPLDVEAATSEFRREAALLACRNNTGLASVHDVGEAAGHPYLVMEFIEGRTLAQVLAEQRSKAQPLQEQQIIAIARDAAQALKAAHQGRLAHRDVKPQNLLVTPEGRTRLIDLGLATLAGQDNPDDEVAGTFLYSAPEQTGMLQRPVDARSDLYALGVVLFESAAGHPPFTGDDVGELLHLHALTPPPDLHGLRPDLSPTLVRIIAKLLAKDPDDRYQSAAGLGADLGDLADEPDEPLSRLDATSSLSSSEHTVPLVGRDREVARLVARWQRAQAGHGGVALVQGRPGAGRGRLAHELAADVRAHGALVLSARCNPDDLVPAAAFRGAIEDHLADVQRGSETHRQEGLDRIRHAAAPLAGLLAGLSPALNRLLGAVDGTVDDRQGQFATAVADLLRDLARLAGGALLVIEDVRWLDSVGRRVLQHLEEVLDRTPLLILATGEADDGGAADQAMERLVSEVGPPIDLVVRLEPLADSQVADLVAAQLGGGDVPVELINHLMTRSGGYPLAVVEYVRAMVEAGALRPSWGSWIVDEEVLDDLRLPEDVVALMASRLDTLEATARRCLLTAAVQGGQFDVGIVAAASGASAKQVRDAVAVAVRHRVVEHRGAGRHAFVHEQIRTTLLADAAPSEVADQHHRIAEALVATGEQTDEMVCEVARHRTAAGRQRAPESVYEACLAAARLLLRQHAATEAVTFFDEASAAAQVACVEASSDVHRDHATALLRTGALDAAQERLERALDHETDRLERARLLELLSRVRYAAADTAGTLEIAGRGMTELGRCWPRQRLLHVLLAVYRVVTGLLAEHWPPSRSPARRRDERHAVEAALLVAASDAASNALDDTMMAAYLARGLHAANRLGPSPQRIRVLGRIGLVASIAGARRYGQRLLVRARREAHSLADPALVAEVEYQRAMALTVTTGRSDALVAVSEQHGRWLPVTDHVRVLTFGATIRQGQGYGREALELAERAHALVGSAPGWLTYQPALSRCSARALLGDADAAAAELRSLRASWSDPGRPPEHRLYGTWAGVIVALERGDGVEYLDEAIDDLDAAGMPSGAALSALSGTNVALGRLAQAHASGGAGRTRRLEQAHHALRVVRGGGRRFSLRVTWQVGRAWEAQLQGRHRVARRHLSRADRGLERTDAPLLEYEVARIRARILQMEGYDTAAMRQARIARTIAVDRGWSGREGWILDEFHPPVLGAASDSSPGVPPRPSTASTEVRLRHRLDALQEVSAAAASVVDRKALIRVVLDATLRILAAERAFLFLADRDSEPEPVLTALQGRTADGKDLHELTDYSATLLDRVSASREALVVTGTAQAVALGSESAVLYGLRSILIAPLLLKGRLIGVLYLDSRVAKGIFAPDDGELLTAIGNQIAASLETAHSAQLEVAVRTAWQQRDLAERLRQSMTELSGTLEPDQVLQRLLATVVSILPGERACLLRVDHTRVTVASAAGPGSDGSPMPDEAGVVGFDVDQHPALEPVLAATVPLVGGDNHILPPPLPDELAAVIGHPRSWMAVPLSARSKKIGIVLTGSGEPDAYGEADADIAAVLAGQATVAYDNAHLFTRVHELATTDMLTGLNNRDHSSQLAEQMIATAVRYGRRLAALMLDIDHFKPVNDTHGHAVGDAVLRAVADRLRATIRTADVLGRYGGEEFVVLVPETADTEPLAERLRAAVSAPPVETDAGPITVTISVGVAELRDGDDLDALLARADAAMYRSKDAGRDRVTLA